MYDVDIYIQYICTVHSTYQYQNVTIKALSLFCHYLILQTEGKKEKGKKKKEKREKKEHEWSNKPMGLGRGGAGMDFIQQLHNWGRGGGARGRRVCMYICMYVCMYVCLYVEYVCMHEILCYVCLLRLYVTLCMHVPYHAFHPLHPLSTPLSSQLLPSCKLPG